MAETIMRFPVLIGDIGGTNARFALLADAKSEPVSFPIVQTADFTTIEDAIRATILNQPDLKPVSAVLAVAGPVEGDTIRLTNHDWTLRPLDMAAALDIGDITLLNDFEAQALAVVALGGEYLEKIGGRAGDPAGSRVVLGPGTGLGVAGLVNWRGTWIPVPGEGGHMDVGPRTERDLAIWPHLEKTGGRVSGEQLVCGRGLVNIYRAVAAADGLAPALQKPAEISAAGLLDGDRTAREALGLFVTYLGRIAGDLALTFMSRGGVYLTGGIAQKIIPALKTGEFRAAFDNKAPHAALLEAMPIHVVTHPTAALIGLAAFAQQPSRFGVTTAGRRWIAGN